MKVLVINAGSSSLKYQLLDPETGHLLAKGLCERIGIDGKFTYKPQVEGKAAVSAADVPMPTHSEAIQAVLSALVDPDNGVISSMKEIDAVGHRVVHGGESFASSVLITDQVMQAVEDCTPLAPLHNPANIIGIEACRAVLGHDVPQVAVFDTAFHQTMPEHAYLYSIPYEYYENDKIRRYGFHGTSHRYVSLRAAEILGRDPAELKVVSCHLGNGSSDFRDLEQAAEKDHHRATVALEIFEYRVRKMIAEYAAAMGGVDVVVFTAGVGENSAETRAHILQGLEFMGITCDPEKNRCRGKEQIISRDGAPVTVMVVPTNEELMIAQDTMELVLDQE